MRRFYETWREYEQEVLTPIGAGPVETANARRTFYAGGCAMLGMVLNDKLMAMSAHDVSVILKAIATEMNEFTNELEAQLRGNSH